MGRGVCVPGQTFVHVQVHVCVHGQACMCTWTDTCVYGQRCVYSVHGSCHPAVLSGRKHTAEPLLPTFPGHCPSNPTSGEGVPAVTCTQGAQLFSPVWETACRTHSDGQCLGPRPCSSDSNHVAQDPPRVPGCTFPPSLLGFLAEERGLQEAVAAAGSSGRTSSKGGSRPSTGALQIGALAL